MKSPKVTDEITMKIISNPLNTKLGQFMQDLDVVLRKIKNRKAAELDETPPEVWTTRNFDDIQGSLNKFPDFFRMGTFIDSTHMKRLSPLK